MWRGVGAGVGGSSTPHRPGAPALAFRGVQAALGGCREGDSQTASITSELAGHPSVLGKGLLFNGAEECVFL